MFFITFTPVPVISKNTQNCHFPFLLLATTPSSSAPNVPPPCRRSCILRNPSHATRGPGPQRRCSVFSPRAPHPVSRCPSGQGKCFNLPVVIHQFDTLRLDALRKRRRRPPLIRQSSLFRRHASDDFSTCLLPADERRHGLMPNGHPLSREENVAWRVSYNLSRKSHPLLSKR